MNEYYENQAILAAQVRDEFLTDEEWFTAYNAVPGTAFDRAAWSWNHAAETDDS